ncbi:hypothetical protein SPWS13_0435 [Shewanella putrefaciens]|nr:hypothetical protein SPWS13_0435 [Shewanella putrefaciens]
MRSRAFILRDWRQGVQVNWLNCVALRNKGKFMILQCVGNLLVMKLRG